MDSYITEEQQVEAIKKWWQENGTSMIVGTALGLAIIFGVRTWNDWRDGKAEAASRSYQQIALGLKQSDPKLVQQAANQLMETHQGSIYAGLGGLAQGAALLEQGDLASARGRLEWVVTQAADVHIKALAQLRLGYLLLDQKDFARALTLATEAATGGFHVEADELRGDVLRAQGDRKGAHHAYQTAFTKLAPNSTMAIKLRMKLDDLGEEL